MIGQQSGLQEQLFYEFRLDGWVPVDHPLRKVDVVLDLGGLRHALTPFYRHTGRPSIDSRTDAPHAAGRLLLRPAIRAALVRRDAPQSGVSMVCRFGLEGADPDHSTFSKNRHGCFRDSALFRRPI